MNAFLRNRVMGFSFNFFGESEHRVFNYKPVYYDPEKEERKRLFGKVDGSMDAPEDKASTERADSGYKPGQYISGSFRDGNYQRTRGTSSNKAQKIIGLVGLILFFVVLYFIAKFYGMLLS